MIWLVGAIVVLWVLTVLYERIICMLLECPLSIPPLDKVWIR